VTGSDAGWEATIFDLVPGVAMQVFGGGITLLDTRADWSELASGGQRSPGAAIIYNGDDHYDAAVPLSRPESVTYDDGDLTRLIGDVVRDVPPRDDNCVQVLLAVRDRLYGGVRGDWVVDDHAFDTRRGREQFGSATGWPLAESPDAVFAAVAAGAGRTGFLRVHRDDIGHAVVLHHGVNGVRALDPATSRRPIEVSSAADVRRLVQGATAVYAVVTDPTGAVIPDAFPPVVRSRSLFQALTDPPDTRLGSTGRGRGRGFTLGNALRRVDPGRSGRPSGTPSDDDYHPSDLTSLSSDGSVRGDDGDAMVVSDEETPPSGARRADTVADSSRPYRRPPREVPDDVVAWRPDGSPGGPATLREYL
ncbi:MAG: hypothetical protein ACRDT8_26100, partial [Micromonosporaceae bacterium]